tara:strand:+ start:323 stop:679 length:357 start_codon:yes stop_codon:yes gene_type:complete
MLNTKEKINTNIFVGQGATYSIGGDSYPYTVIEYKNDIVTLQSDKSVATKNSDYFNNQIYITAPDSNGTKRSFKQYNYYGQKRWFEVYINFETKRWNKTSHPSFLSFGKRVYKQDPSF